MREAIEKLDEVMEILQTTNFVGMYKCLVLLGDTKHLPSQSAEETAEGEEFNWEMFNFGNALPSKNKSEDKEEIVFIKNKVDESILYPHDTPFSKHFPLVEQEEYDVIECGIQCPNGLSILPDSSKATTGNTLLGRKSCRNFKGEDTYKSIRCGYKSKEK